MVLGVIGAIVVFVLKKNCPAAVKGSKILVLNALRRQPHISHFTLQEAIDLSIQLKIPEVYFTHISHQLGLHDEVNDELPSHIQLAYDGLMLKF